MNELQGSYSLIFIFNKIIKFSKKKEEDNPQLIWTQSSVVFSGTRFSGDMANTKWTRTALLVIDMQVSLFLCIITCIIMIITWVSLQFQFTFLGCF